MFDMFQEGKKTFDGNGRLLLVDGPYASFRAYYGYSVDTFRKKDGTPSNCLYGVARTLIQLIGQVKPTHIAFAYDVSRAGHRKDLLPEYKEGRSKTPDELIVQFPVVKKMLSHAQISILEQERLEADDIIATLATQAVLEDWDVRIFSSDRDMYQLVSDKVHILRPQTGPNKTAGFEQMTPSAVEKRYGVCPEQYPELQALIGENADNIPGVPGVGPKTALKWILEYKTLENLLENADQIGGKVGDALRDNIEQVRLNRRVNHLIRDAKLSDDVHNLSLKTPDTDLMNRFFREWEIPSLVGKFNW